MMRIGPFELDVRARELVRDGSRIRLQDQPFEILRALLDRPGEVVTRAELRARLWPDGTFVDFEHSLNAAVKRLRATLGDDADEPRFIETVPRRGYRLLPTAAGCGAERDAEPPRLRRMAVLPFADLSPSHGHAVFGEGLADEVIAQVSTICRGSVAVIGRRSTLAFRDSRERIRHIGQQLGVSYLLEGSVRVDRDRVRVTARLVDARDETLVWSEAYDRPWGSALDLQTELATRVAHAVGDELASATPAPIGRVLTWPASGSPDRPDAYRAFLKGEYYWSRLGDSGLDQALTFYAEGVRLAPTFAAAHTAMARGLLSHAEYYREVPRDALVRAREAALKALQLDARQAEAHLTLADVSRMLDFDWAAARASYDRAITLNPTYEGAHRSFALLLSAIGDHRLAREVAAAALRCDPMCLQVGLNAAWVAYAARDYAAAIETCLQTLDFEARYAPARRLLGVVYVSAGRLREALDVFEHAVGDHPEDHVIRAWAAHAYAVAGERRQAEDLAEELAAAAAASYVPAYARGLAALGLGDLEQAFAAIEAGYDERDPAYSTIATDPRFDGIRRDPRYVRLAALARLPAMAA